MPRTLRLAIAITSALTLAFTAMAVPDDLPLKDQGYLGLVLRDIADGHTVVSRVFAGPFEGTGLASPSLARPDLVVAVDGRAMNAAAFTTYVRSRAPGTHVAIDYRRANARGGAIPAVVDHAEDVERVEVVVEARERWTGTIGRKRGHDRVVGFAMPALLDPADASSPLGGAVADNGKKEPIDRLMGVFAERVVDEPDYHALSRVRAGFTHPFRLPELLAMVTAPAADAPRDPFGTAARLAAENLDVNLPGDGSHGTMPAGRTMQLRWSLEFLLDQANFIAAEALGPLYGDEAFAQQVLDLLDVPATTLTITGPDTPWHLEVVRRSMDVDFERLVAALEHFDVEIAASADDQRGGPPFEVPPELAAAVDGEIIEAKLLDAGTWAIVGGPGPNRYDMSVVGGVVDLGGDDRYEASGMCLGCRAIIDVSGNDVYTGSAAQGPASALLGVTVVDDRGGNDRYEGERLSAGAAAFGAALLLDRGGDDVYIGSRWSLGAGCYGAGMIMDLGRGHDMYLGDFLTQGVGGPRGLGAIIDEGGRDLYRANGPTGSLYGTPAVHGAFNQGVGFGFRHYTAGGVGFISDLGGNDRYEAGEFGQGGAYYHGLGILHDARGRDLYYGNRYGQGFGVHQAMGVLADDAGDDTYWSMTAASQGAGWDIGAGLLLDRAGNDSYQCEALGQGGAAHQAIAMLVDLGGDDRYVAGPGATQGESGQDGYHFVRTGAYSFSLLLDLGGGHDLYSRERPNNAVTSTGSPDPGQPAKATLHGLVIDR